MYLTDAAVDGGSRHFQIPGLLLIAALGSQITAKGWRGLAAKLIIVGTVIGGGWTLARRSILFASFTHQTVQHLSMVPVPQDVFNKMQEIAQKPGEKLIAITEPIQAVALHFTAHASTRFIIITGMPRQPHTPHRGRQPRIIIPHPLEQLEMNKATRAYFADYQEDDWGTYTIGDWIFAETKDAASERHTSIK